MKPKEGVDVFLCSFFHLDSRRGGGQRHAPATLLPRPVHRLREDSSLNLCTGRPPTDVMIPDAV